MTQYQNETLNEREKTHGDYADTAMLAQKLKFVCYDYLRERDKRLPFAQAESLDMIHTKIARLLSGDNNCKDSWDDIAGYANLVSERLK